VPKCRTCCREFHWMDDDDGYSKPWSDVYCSDVCFEGSSWFEQEEKSFSEFVDTLTEDQKEYLKHVAIIPDYMIMRFIEKRFS
jgi:hypothetical protein